MTCTRSSHTWVGTGLDAHCEVCGRWFSYARAAVEMHNADSPRN